MPITTGTASIAPELKTFYHRALLLRAKPNLVYQQATVQVPLPQGYGKAVEFRRFERIPPNTTPLADEITPPAEFGVTVTPVTVTVAEYGGLVKFSRLVQATAFDDFVGHLSLLMGENMGETLDLITRNALQPPNAAPVYQQVTPAGKARTALTNTDIIDFATIRRARALLLANNVKPVIGDPPHGRFLGIIHPNVWEQLLRDPDVKQILSYAAPRGDTNPWFTGNIVHLLGIDFVVTTNAPTYNAGAIAAGDPAVPCYRTLILGREAAGSVILDGLSTDLIIRLPGQPAPGDEFGRQGWVAWYAVYAAAVLNANFGVEIVSAQ